MTVGKSLNKVTRWIVWATAVAVSTTNSSAAMGIVPSTVGQESWKDVRRELSRSSVPENIADGLAEVLGRLETGTDHRLVMRLSYAIVTPEDLEKLDTFWTRFLVQKGEEAGLTTLLEIREHAMAGAKVNRQNYLESWLYLARNGGNYDCSGNCGGGNGGGGLGNGGSNGNGNGYGLGNDRGRKG